jgi:hypothetical protein
MYKKITFFRLPSFSHLSYAYPIPSKSLRRKQVNNKGVKPSAPLSLYGKSITIPIAFDSE